MSRERCAGQRTYRDGGRPRNSMDRPADTVRRIQASLVDCSHWWLKSWRRPPMGPCDPESFSPAGLSESRSSERSFGAVGSGSVPKPLSIREAVGRWKKGALSVGAPRPRRRPKGLTRSVGRVASFRSAIRRRRHHLPLIFVLNENRVKRGAKKVWSLVWSRSQPPLRLGISSPIPEPEQTARCY